MPKVTLHKVPGEGHVGLIFPDELSIHVRKVRGVFVLTHVEWFPATKLTVAGAKNSRRVVKEIANEHPDAKRAGLRYTFAWRRVGRRVVVTTKLRHKSREVIANHVSGEFLAWTSALYRDTIAKLASPAVPKAFTGPMPLEGEVASTQLGDRL